jgi:glycine hydroxymethyltransferase
MGTAEMDEIADIIVDVLKNTKPTTVEKTGKASLAKYTVDENIMKKSQDRLQQLLQKFPLYPEIEIEQPAKILN